MKVYEIMSKNVKYMNKNKTVHEAAKLMEKYQVGAIPVEDSDKLIGMVTDRDLVLKVLAKKKAMDTKLQDLIQGKIKYCYEDEDAKDIAEQMSQLKVRRMPVMNRENKLVGIISLGDLVRDNSIKDKTIEAYQKISV